MDCKGDVEQWQPIRPWQGGPTVTAFNSEEKQFIFKGCSLKDEWTVDPLGFDGLPLPRWFLGTKECTENEAR